MHAGKVNFGAPEMQVLHRALRQLWALGNRLGLLIALGQNATYSALAQFNGESQAYGAAADDKNVSSKSICSLC